MGGGVVGMVDAPATGSAKTKTAVVFPGQGSQSPDMAAAYGARPEIAGALAEASDALGEDLSALIKNKTELDKTFNTQPALLAVSVGVFRAAEKTVFAGENIALMAGHSLGEYTALVCGGALDFVRAVRLVRRRGLLMSEIKGGMAAVLGEPAAVQELCAAARKNGAQIWAANYNSPLQTVVAGDSESVSACAEWTKKTGIKRAVPLPVGAPSHCPLMKPAAEKFLPELKETDWKTNSPKIIHNAFPYEKDFVPEILAAQPRGGSGAENLGDFFPNILDAQLTSPVRWMDTLARFAEEGITRVYECGPGGVLSGLAKRTPDAPRHVALSSAADLA